MMPQLSSGKMTKIRKRSRSSKSKSSFKKSNKSKHRNKEEGFNNFLNSSKNKTHKKEIKNQALKRRVLQSTRNWMSNMTSIKNGILKSKIKRKEHSLNSNNPLSILQSANMQSKTISRLMIFSNRYCTMWTHRRNRQCGQQSVVCFRGEVLTLALNSWKESWIPETIMDTGLKKKSRNWSY